jgi:hypothetical protein
LLYNKNGDILKALSKALGELKVAKKSESNLRQEHNENLAQTSPSAQEMEVSKEMIISVSKHLNKVIISNCKKIAEMYSNNANLYSKFTFNDMVKSIDDVLVTVIQILTTPTESVLTETSSQSAKRDISSPAMSPITKQLNKRR